ncbi:MAG: hypothetical protein MJY64_01055 [archaeon]|nr:hypothetical protein [archaeon]
MYFNHTGVGIGVTGLISLCPTLVLLYFALRKYTYPAVEKPFFSDSKLFILFTVGFIEGTFLSVLLTYILPLYVNGCSGLQIVVSFGVLTEVIKLVTMNLKRFSGKSDTIFYGLGLGLGTGASIGFGLLYYLTNMTEIDMMSWIILIIAMVQHILIHASTGTIVGEGVAKRRPFKFMIEALALSTIFQIMMTMTFSVAKDNSYSALCVSMLTLFILVVNFYVVTCGSLLRIKDEVISEVH